MSLNIRIKELEELIKYHQDLYYNGEAEITDQEFDKLWDELKSLDPNNNLLKSIGSDNNGSFQKAKHIMPMGSQSKAASPDEFRKWFNQTSRGKQTKFSVQYKMDGASIELQYSGGKFIKAVTRGDGNVGDDITNNIQKSCRVCPFIDNKDEHPFTGAIRGEVLIDHYTKDALYPDAENCRNLANGVMKRKDGKGCENLSIIVYDAQSAEDIQSWKYESEKLLWLKKSGFTVVENREFTDCEEIITYRNEVNITRSVYEYDIDGVVVKCNEIDMEDLKKDRPKKQIAFKFVLDEVHSTLLDVQWSPSGKIRTPVAVCSPVRIAGTTVKRANLANYGLIKKMGLKIGDKVILVKRGEIIPKIEGVVKTELNKINKNIAPPSKCECCGSALIQEGVNIICPNEKCPETLSHHIQKWISTLDIKYIGNSTIHKLVENNHISNISDLYKPEFYDALVSETNSVKLSQKIMEEINSHKNVNLEVFVAGFDIDSIGTKIIKSLMGHGFDSLDKLRNAKVQDLSYCSGIGYILADKLLKGLNEAKDVMDEVLKLGVVIKNNVKGGVFEGASACFTGSFNKYSRTELENIFKMEGGKIGSKINKNTSFLVSSDPASRSGKTLAARELNIPIINEQEFLKFINKE
jgi:DNA ligase (NAD+)